VIKERIKKRRKEARKLLRWGQASKKGAVGRTQGSGGGNLPTVSPETFWYASCLKVEDSEKKKKEQSEKGMKREGDERGFPKGEA